MNFANRSNSIRGFRRVDVGFNKELFNTRSTTSRLHFGEKKLCRSIRNGRRGRGEEGKEEEEE